MHLNLHLLRLFHAVAEHGSFSRAADALHISQPAVSKGVRQLELQLDVPLIERLPGGPRGAGVRLTDEGRALFDHACGLFALERAAVDDLQARVEARRGHLTIGASTTVAGYWLPPVLAAFHARYPDVAVTVRVGNTQAMGRALVACAVDVAVVEGWLDDRRLTAQPWRDDPLAIVVPPAARGETVGELLRRPWLLREPGSGTRVVTDAHMAALSLTPEHTLEIASNVGIARAVAAGLGVAMLPLRVVEDLLRLGDVATVAVPGAPRLSRPLYVMRLAARAPSRLVDAFAAVLEAAEAPPS